MGRKKGKRNRDRASNPPAARGVWVWDQRAEMKALLTSRGVLRVSVFDAGRVGVVGREYAAAWLREHFVPQLDHESCYLLLWGECPPAPDSAARGD